MALSDTTPKLSTAHLSQDVGAPDKIIENPPVAFVTCVTSNYVHYARALFRSVREFHPQAQFFVLIVDRRDGLLDPAAEPFVVLFGDQLEIPDWSRMAFQYTAMEMSCALKPFIMRHLLGKGLARGRLCYLDSDLQLHAPMNPMLDRLASNHIVLFPHLRSVGEDRAQVQDEQAIRLHGVFNGGLLALDDSAEAMAMLSWWASKTARLSIKDVAVHLSHDQAWLEAVPALFDGVCVYRNPVYNLAYWNLGGHKLRRASHGAVTLDGEPLVCFHFSILSTDPASSLPGWASRLDAESAAVATGMEAAYRKRLADCGQRECEAWGYGYARLSDGTPIHPLWREAVRQEHPLVAEVEDPFDASQLGLKSRYRKLEWLMRNARVDWALDPALKASHLGLGPSMAERMLRLRWLQTLIFRPGLRIGRGMLRAAGAVGARIARRPD